MSDAVAGLKNALLLVIIAGVSFPANLATASDDALRGLVVDETGMPVAGASVILARDDPRGQVYVPLGESATTNAHGEFELLQPVREDLVVVVQAGGRSAVAHVHHVRTGPIRLGNAVAIETEGDQRDPRFVMPKPPALPAPSISGDLPPLSPAIHEKVLEDPPSVALADPFVLTVLYFSSFEVSPPWPINVPYPIDVDGDRVKDGTIWASVGITEGLPATSVCLEYDIRVATLLGGVGPQLGVFYQGNVAAFHGDSLPGSASACATFQVDGSIGASLDTSPIGPSAPFALLVGEISSLSVIQYDRPPQNVHVGFRPASSERFEVTYEAEANYDILVGFVGSFNAAAALDGVPTNFELAFERQLDPGISRFIVDYLGAASTARMIATVETEGRTAGVQVESLPSRFAEQISFHSPIPDFWEVSINHQANARTPKMQAWGTVKDLSGYAQVDNVPTGLRTLVRGIASQGSLVDLFVDHYTGLDQIDQIFVDADNATAQFYALARQLPSYSNLQYTTRHASAGGNPAPWLSFSGTAPGGDLYAHVEGDFLGGGFIDLALEGLPRRLTTDFPPPPINEALNIRLNAAPDIIDLIYVDAFLPVALADKPIQSFTIYLEGLGRVNIDQRRVNASPFPCYGCQAWWNRDVGYGFLRHPDIAFLGLHLSVLWKAQDALVITRCSPAISRAFGRIDTSSTKSTRSSMSPRTSRVRATSDSWHGRSIDTS